MKWDTDISVYNSDADKTNIVRKTEILLDASKEVVSLLSFVG
jgi:hypothetical protein